MRIWSRAQYRGLCRAPNTAPPTPTASRGWLPKKYSIHRLEAFQSKFFETFFFVVLGAFRRTAQNQRFCQTDHHRLIYAHSSYPIHGKQRVAAVKQGLYSVDALLTASPYSDLLARSNNGVLRRGAAGEVVEKYGNSRRAMLNLWKRYCRGRFHVIPGSEMDFFFFK